jgi:hypothetical protein
MSLNKNFVAKICLDKINLREMSLSKMSEMNLEQNLSFE